MLSTTISTACSASSPKAHCCTHGSLKACGRGASRSINIGHARAKVTRAKSLVMRRASKTNVCDHAGTDDPPTWLARDRREAARPITLYDSRAGAALAWGPRSAAAAWGAMRRKSALCSRMGLLGGNGARRERARSVALSLCVSARARASERPPPIA